MADINVYYKISKLGVSVYASFQKFVLYFRKTKKREILDGASSSWK